MGREVRSNPWGRLRITRQPIGYLINFGPMGKLQWKRFVLSEYLEDKGTADKRS